MTASEQPESGLGHAHEDAVNLWADREHVLSFLRRREDIPHRADAYEVMLELLPERLERVLDLGCGDGQCLALVRAVRPEVAGVALDFSAEMLRRARDRFEGMPVEVVEHSMDDPLPDLGQFDLVVSGFAIHHLVDERKRELFVEILAALRAGGAFINVEHVDSPTADLHLQFLTALGQSVDEDDPSNKLVSVHTQLGWMRDVGFENVDCFWKWRELAVLAGWKPLVGGG